MPNVQAESMNSSVRKMVPGLLPHSCYHISDSLMNIRYQIFGYSSRNLLPLYGGAVRWLICNEQSYGTSRDETVRWHYLLKEIRRPRPKTQIGHQMAHPKSEFTMCHLTAPPYIRVQNCYLHVLIVRRTKMCLKCCLNMCSILLPPFYYVFLAATIFKNNKQQYWYWCKIYPYQRNP